MRIEAGSSLSPGSGLDSSLLRPGDNCWRVERADHVRVLIDGAEYFAVLERLLQGAARSIYIIGWDFDGRIALKEGVILGPFLRNLVERRPELQVRILVWSVAVLHASSAPRELLLPGEWQDHPNIQLRLDTHHPIYGAHHQKIVVLDDSFAFAGGIDLTVARRDDPHHLASDPNRKAPDGASYGPVHDLQVLVDGAAARALGDLARDRWRRAVGEVLAPEEAAAGGWPKALRADFVNHRVAISRTMPAMGDDQAVRESSRLLIELLRAARQTIYIESQYFANFAVGQLLAASLKEPKGPEIIILVTRETHGLLERLTMGANRDRILRLMKRSDRFDRLRAFFPVVPDDQGERDVLIHAKLLIIDDTILRIGSSNINNRSCSVDSECDLTILAESEADKTAIHTLRLKLIAEHLGVLPAEVEAASEQEGSLVKAIDALNVHRRGLRPYADIGTKGPVWPFFGSGIFDPRRTFEPLWWLRRRRQKSARSAG